ncbi:MAG: hypothetical protein RIB71_22870 [Imperialibacter sp.]|uniref:hypothetical protein n=1 Tax=Imperialibacter sp. TaxID=2038411 RepID=UPI0032F04BF9
MDLGFYVKKEEKVRLARINAPELTADALAGSHPTSYAWQRAPNRPCPSRGQKVLPRRLSGYYTNTEGKAG